MILKRSECNFCTVNLRCKAVFPLLAAIAALCMSAFSCAGGASGGGEEAEGTALCVTLPSADNSRGVWQTSDVEQFTVTVASSSYRNSKTASRGETLTFSSIPMGHYDITAIGMKSTGEVTARGEASVDVVANQTSHVSITLRRLSYHTVSFYKNTTDAAPYLTQKVSEGYTVTRPDDPAPDAGKTFSFWTSDPAVSDSSAPFSFNTLIADDLTLYAVFGVEHYTITYDSPAGAVASEEYTVAAAHTLPTPAAPTGFTFGGWFDNSSFTGDAVTTIPLGTTGNKTYYAKFSGLISVDSGPDASLSQISVVYGSTIDSTALPTPSLTGCTWNGRWYKKPSGGEISSTAYDFTTPVTETFMLCAKFTVTVSFGNCDWADRDLWRGDKLSVSVYGYGPTSPDPELTFGGWYLSTDGGATLSTKFSFSNPVNENITLYPKWVREFTIDGFLAADFSSITTSETSPYNISLTGVTNSNISQLRSKIYGNATSGDMENVYITLDLSQCTGLTTLPTDAFDGLDAGWNTNSSATNKHRGSLVAITLPDTITSIGTYAFFQSALKTINIPEGVTSIGQSAFNQAKLTGELRLPSTLTTLGRWAFSSNNHLTKVYAPEGLDLSDAGFGCSIERY